MIVKGNSMSKNNGTAWKTKYGPRRVRHEEATLTEAIAAAQGLSDDLEQQIEIASSLMGLPQDQVRAALLNLAPARKELTRSVISAGSSSGASARPRVVLVESKRPRRASIAQR
ncbi:MAG: hypothetical protein NW200_07455 [Hyphomonadaceae bacterium]|nr:hypothetical protein [Hyphomonadaceae bacterium]